MLGDDTILPLMNVLGIDDCGDSEEYERSWDGVKNFSEEKMQILTQARDEYLKSDDGQLKLYSSVLSEVIDTIKQQLSQMKFFSEDKNLKDPKMKYALLTNMGCEGEFAKISNRIDVSGGSTDKYLTHSRKNIVSTDKYLTSEAFISKSEEEKLKTWKWARSSNEVKKAKEIERRFIDNVGISNKLAILRKEQVKKRKTERTLKMLDACKSHGGPLSLSNLHSLDTLNQDQLLLETSFLRSTVAPNIRQKRRVKSTDSTKAYSYENFTV